MKFLIDADCPRSLGIFLIQAGFQVLDIRDIDPSAPDQKIYEMIQEKSLVLITRDTDFSNILRYPVTPHCGIILLRTHLISTEEMVIIIKDLLNRVTEKNLFGSLTIVRKDRYRIRKMKM